MRRSSRFPTFFLILSVIFCSEFISGSHGEVVPLNGSLANFTHPPPGFQAIMNVGVILPDTTVNTTDIMTQLIAEFSMTALEIAANDINENGVIPNVYVNLLYASSSINPNNAAAEIFSAADLLRANVSAVIGDLFSASTEYSALMTSKLEVPQCSFASSTAALSNKSLYKYFFRTEPSVYGFAFVFGEYINSMNWSSVAMLVGDGDFGSTFAVGLNDYALSNDFIIGVQHSIFDINNDPTPELEDVKDSGINIILLILNNSTQIILTLQQAKTMGMLNEQYVWVTVRDIHNDIQIYYEINGGDVNELNGLVMLGELTDLHGIVKEYDIFLSEWMNFPNLSLHNQAPNDLNFMQTHAYSCLMVIARGFNQSLNNYEGGRAAGIQALQQHTYNTTNLTPLAFNTNYTGPDGFINFTDTGDVDRGNFLLLYLWNGTSMQFGTDVNNTIKFSQKQVFYGNTTIVPSDMLSFPSANYGYDSIPGIMINVVAAIGITVCFATIGIVILYRNNIIIKSASPLFCCLELFGIAMNYSSLYLTLYTTQNFICLLRPLFLCISYILVMSGVILKSYRIHKVFSNIFAKRTNVRDAALARFVFLLVAVNVLLTAIVYLMNPPKIIQVPVSPGFNYNTCQAPLSNGSLALQLFQNISLSAIFFYAIFLAYKTRNVPARWSEAKSIAYVIYNVSIACVLASPALFLPESQIFTSDYLLIIAMTYVSTSIYVILFVPKLIMLFKSNTNGSDAGMSYLSTPATVVIAPTVGLQAGVPSTKIDDMHVEMHEGFMPIREQRKWLTNFSVWYMRKIILFPGLGYFLIVNDQTLIPKAVYYTSAEHFVTHQPNEHIIKVNTKTSYEYLIQVKDDRALTDWLQVFNNSGMHALTTPPLDLPSPPPKKAKTKGKRRTLDPEDDESILLTAKFSLGFVDTGSVNSEGPSDSSLKEEPNIDGASSLTTPYGLNTFGEVEDETRSR